MPFIHHHYLMFQHDITQPQVTRICAHFPVLPWPAYSPDISPIEHVWDALDRCLRQHVPVPANNIPQATINSLINSMRRRCVVLFFSPGLIFHTVRYFRWVRYIQGYFDIVQRQCFSLLVQRTQRRTHPPPTLILYSECFKHTQGRLCALLEETDTEPTVL